MDIPSAFSSGLQGFQRASNGVTEATVNINRETVNEQRVRNAEQAVDADAAQQAIKAAPIPDLTDSLVQLTTEANYAEANVRSIKTADEVLGTLLDVKA